MSFFPVKTKIPYANLGKSGLKVPKICLGCMSYGDTDKGLKQAWRLSAEQSKPFFAKSLELGINFFDTADFYAHGDSETIIGKILFEDLKVKREDVILATKVGLPMDDTPNNRGLSRKHINDSIEASLKRLRTSYVDVYWIHRFDPDTPIEETMKTLHDLVTSGKVRYIGASSMWAYQFVMMNAVAEKNGWTKFTCMQNFYNLLYREEEREMNKYCKQEGIALLPWSPLAGGFLTGTRVKADQKKEGKSETATARSDTDNLMNGRFEEASDWAIIERVKALADKKKVKPAQIALAWLWEKGTVSPIIGATKLSHLEDAVGALAVKLDADDVKYLEEMYKPKPIMGHA